MHVLQIPDSPEVAADGRIKPGRYILEDCNAGTFMLLYQNLRPKVEPFVSILHEKNDRVLIIGTMGFGDALLLTPVLREMKRQNPGVSIDIATLEPQRAIFFGLPYIDGFVDYPTKLEVLQDFGTVLFLEHSVEFNMLAKIQHMTDRFAQHLEVEDKGWPLGKKPDFKLSESEQEWCAKTFSRTKGRRRLAVQVQAGARNRSYPISKIAGVIAGTNGTKPRPSMLDQMVQDGWEVGLVGAPGEFRVDSCPKGVIDMTRFGLTFRQSAAFISSCDCFLGPDSGLLHVAGAMDIPSVGLFGAFPWKLRTAYYDSAHALHGEGVCPLAPCFHSHHPGLPVFPPNGPCATSGICDELASIQPDRIRAKLEQVARHPVEVLRPDRLA